MSAVRRRALRESFTHRGFRPECRGYRCVVEVAMQRIRIERKPAKPRRRPAKILPLDPRDPDIVRAKAIQERYVPPRRRAA